MAEVSARKKTVVFDLDGTVYQNTVFHRSYIEFLLDSSEYVSWRDALIDFTERVLMGQALRMNSFYRAETVRAESPNGLFRAMEAMLCPDMGYGEAMQKGGVVYLGDEWAVLSFIGASMGLCANGRGDIVYRRTRERMERDGMSGDPALASAIKRLSKRLEVVLLSNSYEETALEFLRQLGYEGVFQKVGASANKPYSFWETLERVCPGISERPESVISIGDHAFNDLMPVAARGGKTVYINPFPNIEKPECDVELDTLDSLRAYLDTL